MSTFDRYTWCPFKIMNAQQTINYVNEHKCSLSRFGDGELQIAAYGCSLKFQRADYQLQNHLRKVIHSTNKNLLLCLPNRINMVSAVERNQLSNYWRRSLRVHLHEWTKLFERSRIYGDTNLTRLTDGSTDIQKYELVRQIQQLWKNRDVIIVEGSKTRFGVGNSLLEDTCSVHRILGPAESAYDYYDILLNETKKLAMNYPDPIVLLALGPTATVMASDLADQYIQAIDLGHLDICFEHLKTGSDGAVPGKYTNEAIGGNIVSECVDEDYLKQIVFDINKCILSDR